MNEKIKILNEDAKTIAIMLKKHKENFRKTLIDFKHEHKLDGAVTRKNGEKIEHGKLSIIETDRYGYNGNIMIPCYFIFTPYRKTGEISNVKRTDKFEANSPGEYLEKILEIYSPAD